MLLLRAGLAPSLLLLVLCSSAVVVHTRADSVGDLDSADAAYLAGNGTNERYRCLEAEEVSSDLYPFHMRGTNLGGLFVLEPWITPSLFYQFLGADERWGAQAKEHVGMDMYTFCTALQGPPRHSPGVGGSGDSGEDEEGAGGAGGGSKEVPKTEANRQLRRHWETWVTEEEIATLAAAGLDTIRVPVGDWMFRTYGPYEDCTAGSVEVLDRVIGWIGKHGMRAILDIHAAKGSQNGFDNSGQARHVQWSEDGSSFTHWQIRAADWCGVYSVDKGEYVVLNATNVEGTLKVIEAIVNRYSSNDAVLGVQALNEPWEHTPPEVLKKFYWDAYIYIQNTAPHMLFMMHDAFRLNHEMWFDFMHGCPNVVFDTHIYQAWQDMDDAASYVSDACGNDAISEFESRGAAVVVGEWSLATDNCALWLNGFNDNLMGFPKRKCHYVPCPEPYMGPGQPNAPPDSSKGPQGPMGTAGWSTPQYGLCPIDALWDDEDAVMTQIAHAKLANFDAGHGWFFWNFKCELEPRWSYLDAIKRGWIPADVSRLDENEDVQQACPITGAAAPGEGDDVADSATAQGEIIGLIMFAFGIMFVVSLSVAKFARSTVNAASGTEGRTKEGYSRAQTADVSEHEHEEEDWDVHLKQHASGTGGRTGPVNMHVLSANR